MEAGGIFGDHGAVGGKILGDGFPGRQGVLRKALIEGVKEWVVGILAGLLCCEMVARRGKSLGVQLRDLFVKVGSYYPKRENFHLTPQVKEKFTKKLGQNPKEFCGRKVTEVVRTDGLKLVCQGGSWVCYRLSGTEPVVRVYSEAASEAELESLSASAKEWIFE